MSTTPPEQPQMGSRPNMTWGAMYPMPGNAEAVVYVIAAIIVAIIALASDRVGAGEFVISYTVITLGYLISRGIAKAGKVLER